MPRLTIYRQLFLAFGLLVVLPLGTLGGVIGSWVEAQALMQTEERLKAKANMLQVILRHCARETLQSEISDISQKNDARITVIDFEGNVVAESSRDPAELGNHGNRPEIEEAHLAGIGTATRYSTTLQKNMMYVALRTTDVKGIEFVRVAVPITEIQAQAAQLRNLVLGVAGGTALVALLLAWWLTRRLALPLQELASGADQIAAGHYGQKVYVDRKDELGQLGATFNHMSTQLADQFAQLDEDRQQLRAVLSSMVEGVIAIDSEQSILFANERAGAMLEFATNSAAGRKLWEVVRQYSVQEMVRAAMHTDNGEAHRLEFTDAAGKTLMLHIAQLPGEPMRGAVLVFHDNTELRRLEHLRQDFVANVSHELKTPLSVITVCAETLLEGGMDDLEHRGRFLERIHEQAHRLHTLILDLLSLARIESGDQHWTFQALSVADLAEACVERHQTRTQAKKQSLLLEPPSNGPKLQAWADEEALAEILDNLVDNAVKYTPEGGTIHLRWWSEGDQCIIEVKDTGIGIPEHDLPRVFERFYRVDKARSREVGGTGLGLSIVKHLVQAMQGTIRATSELGRGSTFTIRLPMPAPY
jgi:two-component system, OmpR family, phosphate regulon sensor histidine kinase PhoR